VILDVEARRLDVDIPASELSARSPAPAATAAYASPARGWQSLYVDTVQQADTGADLSFLVGASGAEVTRDSH
jgi:dihydroxyacid dehydratase/phosphogluconate dehydratase